LISSDRNDPVQYWPGKTFRKITNNYDIVLNLRDLNRFQDDDGVPTEISSIYMKYKYFDKWSKMLEWNGLYYGSSTRQGSPILFREQMVVTPLLNKNDDKNKILDKFIEIPTYASYFQITNDINDVINKDLFINSREEFIKKIKESESVCITELFNYESIYTCAKVENVGNMIFYNVSSKQNYEYYDISFELFKNDEIVLDLTITKDEICEYMKNNTYPK